MTEIGTPVPKGIVDPANDFVGIAPQEINFAKEITRLRRQLRRLRTQAENMDWVPRPDHRLRTLAGLALSVGVAGLAFALWRSRDTAPFWRRPQDAFTFPRLHLR